MDVEVQASQVACQDRAPRGSSNRLDATARRL